MQSGPTTRPQTITRYTTRHEPKRAYCLLLYSEFMPRFFYHIYSLLSLVSGKSTTTLPQVSLAPNASSAAGTLSSPLYSLSV